MLHSSSILLAAAKGHVRRMRTILFLKNRRFSAACSGKLQIINIRAIYSQQIFNSGKFSPGIFPARAFRNNYFICVFRGGVKRCVSFRQSDVRTGAAGEIHFPSQDIVIVSFFVAFDFRRYYLFSFLFAGDRKGYAEPYLTAACRPLHILKNYEINCILMIV